MSAPAVASPQKAKKTAAKKVAPTHPTYLEMIKAAILHLKERKGSSRQKILAYIRATYKVNDGNVNTCLKSALKRGVVTGDLKQPKGTGASGSFKLGDKKEPKKKAVAKRKAKSPKKAAAKKAKKPAKKAKKPAAKKPAAKKPVAKKATKKPAAKKPAAKKVKKVVKKKAAKKGKK